MISLVKDILILWRSKSH